MKGKSKTLIRLLTALSATLALVLWMANREPFAFGPLWGALIATVASVAWVAWILPATPGEVIPWRETTLGRQPGEL